MGPASSPTNQGTHSRPPHLVGAVTPAGGEGTVTREGKRRLAWRQRQCAFVHGGEYTATPRSPHARANYTNIPSSMDACTAVLTQSILIGVDKWFDSFWPWTGNRFQLRPLLQRAPLLYNNKHLLDLIVGPRRVAVLDSASYVNSVWLILWWFCDWSSVSEGLWMDSKEGRENSWMVAKDRHDIYREMGIGK